jgi:flavin-dependent dehydrogenase
MYDVIIVGARCAGSPLAMLLARQGHSVLAVDRGTFPSDIMSTHFIQRDGVARLRDWGLLDRVLATNCPPLGKMTASVDGNVMPAPPADLAQPDPVCPRRTYLDALLVEAAREAGAEIREGFSVQRLLRDGDAVTGVSGRDAGGRSVEEHARITVGADGMHSLVAREVGPEEYNTNPALSCGYYAYFSGVEMDGAELHIANRTGILAFPTNDGQVCVAVARPRAYFDEYRGDIEQRFFEYLEAAVPDLARRVRAGTRDERFIGTADTANFFRKPFGTGWALVGDAGYHKDPVTGLGIADAFRDADFLAEALHAGLSGAQPLDDALAAWQARRDAAAKPLYEMTMAFAQYPTMPELMSAMAASANAPATA